MEKLNRALLIGLALIMALFFSGAMSAIVRAQSEAPSVTLDPFPEYTNDPTPTFTGTAIGSGAPIRRVEYRVDSGDWIRIIDPNGAQPVDGDWDELIEEFTFTTAELSDGQHLVEVRAIDAAGYTTASADYATVTFWVEFNKPSVTLVSLSPDPTNDPTPTLSGAATDATSPITSVEYRVDGGDWIAAEAIDATFDELSEDFIFTTAGLANGEHLIEVRAIDAAENVSALESDTFTVDTTAPSVTITDIPELINRLDLISSTASDIPPGELDKVRVMINNASQATYWNGTNWVASETWLGATGVSLGAISCLP